MMSWDECLSNILMFFIGVLVTLTVTQFLEAGRGHGDTTNTPSAVMEAK